MQITFKITYADKKVDTVETVIGDFVAWERKTNKKVTDLSGGSGIEDLSFLAWHCVKRLNQDAPDFDVWINSVIGIEGDNSDPKFLETAQSTEH